MLSLVFFFFSNVHSGIYGVFSTSGIKPHFICLVGLCAKYSAFPGLKCAVQIKGPCVAILYGRCIALMHWAKTGSLMQNEGLFTVSERETSKLISYLLVVVASYKLTRKHLKCLNWKIMHVSLRACVRLCTFHGWRCAALLRLKTKGRRLEHTLFQ